jgi:xanthine dehydrogenase accessory factor
MRELLKAIRCEIEGERPCAVATVLDTSGSAPRAAGAKMLVRQDGTISGTVGGGQVEAEVIKAARAAISAGQSVVLRYNLRGDLGQGLDMICGGEMELLVHVLSPTGEEQALYGRQLQGQPGAILLTLWRSGDDGQPAARPAHDVIQCLVSHHGELLAGELAPPHAGVNTTTPAHGIRFARVTRQGDSVILAEPLFAAGTVHIYGGGHISLHVAELCQRVGFTVEVMDDREEFSSRERFPGADLVHTARPAFAGCIAADRIDADSHVVIVTRGHAHDREVLAQALRTRAGYIGMIGSKRKRDATYRALLDEGFQQQEIDRVHCPIGLAIGAETPEEIAVSIVAELIQARARRASAG